MRSFAVLPVASSPVRVLLVGAGGMGRKWLSALTAAADVELVGVVDLNESAARAALRDMGFENVPTGTSLTELVASTGAQAVVNVTVPEAHQSVNVEALFLGLPVLCEKPVAPTVSQGLSIAAASQVSGQLLMISQSRRYYRNLALLKERARSLGEVGLVTTELYKAPRFGGFREEMDHVLLVDMAIHAFDAARYLLDREPISVYCEEFNPKWSWYAGDAAATALFEFRGGVRYVYTGSWCSPGLETSWNGNWRVSGAYGTATWDGANEPLVEVVREQLAIPQSENHNDMAEEIEGSLAEFVHATRTGEVPSGEVHDNVLSLAMVEAAVRSAELRRRVDIDEILDDAHATALAEERLPEVLAALLAWTSPRDVVTG